MDTVSLADYKAVLIDSLANLPQYNKIFVVLISEQHQAIIGTIWCTGGLRIHRLYIDCVVNNICTFSIGSVLTVLIVVGVVWVVVVLELESNGLMFGKVQGDVK